MADWFYASRYGYGAGPPCSWQGWLVTIVYLAIAIGSATLLGERNLAAFLGVFVPATLIFLLVAYRTTKGGWKWRWGKDGDTL